jgi:glycosyltransferase involved in cell wall biosynthesis
MRVLHINERAGFYGGVEQILFDTAAGLRRLGWPQALLHQDPNPDHGYTAAFDQASAQEAILRSFAPDVVFIHRFESVPQIRRLASAYPTVRMVHDHDLVCIRRHKYFPLSSRVCDRPAGIACYQHLCFIQRSAPGSRLPIALRGVTRCRQAIQAHAAVRCFLVGSRWMRRELEINGIPDDKIEIVPPIPAALDATRPVAPAEESHEILFVGQVIRGKGVDLLLRALQQVSPPWHATVVGAGNHLDSCRKLAAELGINERVDFTGWVPHQELEPLYSGAALTVVPSRWPEPFGMVGIEAMARGRPVVGFAVGGIPDWLEDEKTGLLVAEADTAAMAEAIGRILENRDLRYNLGEAAARRVKQRYQPRIYLRQLMHILEKIA